MPRAVAVPESLLKTLSIATRAFHELEDELEDFLLTSDPEFLAKMRSARQPPFWEHTTSQRCQERAMYRIATTPQFDADLKRLDRKPSNSR